MTSTAHQPLAMLAIVFSLMPGSLFAASDDWPTWRHDATRSGFTASQPKLPLHPAWKRTLPKPMPAWPSEQGKIQFDASYEPVAADGLVFIPSMVTGQVTAYEMAGGESVWSRYCEAPVRFAPVVWKDLLLVAADDGALYAWEKRTGRLRWKFAGAPRNRWMLGNDRLISMWPARGAPVVKDDVVYFAAGIWPFMGVFVYAVDAKTGEEIWANSDSGSKYLVQQHNSPAFAGVAPQGYLAVGEDRLLVAGGRTTPASFDRKTGKFLFFRPSDRTLGKNAGGYQVMIGDDWYANNGGVYGMQKGDPWVKASIAVVQPKSFLAFSKGQATWKDMKVIFTPASVDRRGEKKEAKRTWATKRQAKLREATRVLLQTGELIWAEGDPGELLAFDVSGKGTEIEAAWSTKLPARIWQAIYANGHMIVVTDAGEVYAYSTKPTAKTATYELEREPRKLVPDEAAERLTKNLPPAPGYALLLGWNEVAAQRLMKSLSGRVIVLEQNAELVETARRSLDQSGLLGERVDVIHCAKTMRIAPYFADLVLCRDRETGEAIARGETQYGVSIETVRPYGGSLCFYAGTPQSVETQYGDLFRDKQYEVRRENQHKFIRIIRKGPLKNTADWTHQNGDVANSLVSLDQRVKSPLGMLWFGGPSHQEVLPRHGHGPAPQVIAGRLLIEGPHMLRAVDVYTGRLMWQRQFPNLGLFYDNTGHHPGAGAIGGNYVSTEDSIYVVYGQKCLRLEPTSGKTLAEFELPERDGRRPYLGYLGVQGNHLILGVEPTSPLSKSRWKEDGLPRFGEGSQGIAVLDRFTGELRWSREAVQNFRHNAIVASGDTLFCIDRMTSNRLKLMKRRGEKLEGQSQLLALALDDGELRWRKTDNVFGTWLGYSVEHDVVLQAGSKNRDRATDEAAKGMVLYQAQDGKVVWSDLDRFHAGPCMLLGDRIISQGAAFDLLSGQPLHRDSALNRGKEPWSFIRAYGCNTAIGCPNMLTFRSAAAGYYDLAGESGTGNWGGFRSSCTSNLIPANGVLNAPDYTRTCNCSYQNQCSLALVYSPDVETWTFRKELWNGKAVEQLGVNFGAPGDRKADDDVLWVDFPSVGGPSPDIPVEVKGNATYHCEHSLRVAPGESPAWIRGSGVSGAKSISLTLDRKAKTPKTYSVLCILRPRKANAADARLRIGEVERVVSGDKSEYNIRFDGTVVTNKLVVELSEDAASDWMLCGVQVKLLPSKP